MDKGGILPVVVADLSEAYRPPYRQPASRNNQAGEEHRAETRCHATFAAKGERSGDGHTAASQERRKSPRPGANLLTPEPLARQSTPESSGYQRTTCS